MYSTVLLCFYYVCFMFPVCSIYFAFQLLTPVLNDHFTDDIFGCRGLQPMAFQIDHLLWLAIILRHVYNVIFVPEEDVIDQNVAQQQ